MADDPRLEGTCPRCDRVFFLREENLSPDRQSYFCPHCGERERMSPEMKEAVFDMTSRKVP